ncbi:hypothetical protein [Brachyspira aalborgi]|jgi:hypothetical protein|uniref:Phage recombination protein Bet n=1 Tax=Brachyspira aalborgi TaxID=29522 RepID=A0ABY3K6T0_9SPIR|nr:hypothetical protein [Brachyspira aalborgi]TXJ31193.1 hypothetical protein EPJ71_10690 [Brachyspira aalborgi]TXJ40083.1 hypothetical protein EPJ65_12630 [Brachyspira aalborgi]DAZ18852.1 MAG TPA: RecT protein [Caudoviricetes sp.]
MKNEITTNIQKTNFNTKDLIEISKRVAGSGLLGSRDENQIFTLMMLAYKDGINPVQASMDYHIIQGKPALSSQATLVRFQKAGGKIKYIKRTDTECTIEFMHEQAGELTITWNMERAKQAGLNLNKQNWKQYPRQMLAARCIAEGVRALYPACLDGLYLVEEVQDFDKPFNNQKSNNKVIDTQAESIDNSKYNIETNTYTIDDAEQYNTVPNGKNKGKLWKNLDIETLDKALQYYKEKNEDNYSNVIEKILLEKIEREKQQNENNEATDIKVSEDEDVYNNKEDEYMFGDDEDEIEDRDDEIIDFGE